MTIKRRIVCISDTHGLHDQVQVPDGDYLIHAGDLTNIGEIFRVPYFAQWMKSQPHEYKIAVAGNHDFCFEKKSGFELIAEQCLVEAGINYLNEDGIQTIGGLHFWGSPITPTFMRWAFMKDRGQQISKHWSQIPNGIDVLITHGPPLGFCDKAHPDHNHLGCNDLRSRVEQVKPLLNIFGHIHGGYGTHVFNNSKSIAVNASCVNEAYKVVNKPIVIDLEIDRYSGQDEDTQTIIHKLEIVKI